MRPFPVLLVSLLVAGPALAQEIGQRTRPAEAMIPGLGLSPADDDLREAIAAANLHPLGSLENPVRVGGPQGERVFLHRLRCPDGSAPTIGPRADAGIGGFGSVIGGYDLACGSMRTRILFDPYHEEHREDRAPSGLTLLPS